MVRYLNLSKYSELLDTLNKAIHILNEIITDLNDAATENLKRTEEMEKKYDYLKQ